MAAYAALLSLAQTTHLNRSHLFSSDAEEKVRSILDYVDFLLLFFKEFPEKVNRWECRIRDVAYKIEDIVEVFVWKRLQSSHRVMNPSRVKLADQLENVVEEIGLIAGEVMEERPAYLPSSSSSSSRLAPTSNDAVIGLHDDVIAIMERLCGQSSNLQFIPIVGMGGIGKTTLARTVYDNQFIIDHFDFRAWVVVSQDYSPPRFRKMLLDSIKLLDEQMYDDDMDDSEIELKVFQHLKGRRYLVVIDDVWGIDVLDDVRRIFPDDNNGSRIMLTTRQLDVAVYPDSACPLHEMRFLDDSQSWNLLKHKVFTNGYCPPDLEDVGKEIARRCAGLPLAVVLVAGFLSLRIKTRASWEEIAQNVNPMVGRELEEILSLSYTYLPHYVRPCFLFIGGFLEDINIRTSRLIRLWVAEGFLMHQNERSKSMEEEAEEYLEDLVKRNLVIVTRKKSDGRIKSCSLHDMVQDFCIRKAREEKFLHVMDGHDLPRGLMNERRISFTRSDMDKIWGPTFRTILCFQIKMLPRYSGSYKLLRILDALGIDLKVFPPGIFELYHLRYLALMGLMGYFSIPSDVSNLLNLQTLIIHLRFGKLRGKYNGGVPHSLPLEIWRMPQLRHLFFHAPYMLPHPPKGLNLQLENLQTIFLVANVVWNVKILQMIPNVKRLGLTYMINQEYHLHHLKDLHQLEKLEVFGYPDFSWREQNPCFPSTLKKLTLVGGGFPWEDMVILGLLPNLEVLKLLGDACDGETWEITDEEFPQLKVLLIDDSHLQQWITQSNPLPTLKHLVLRSCWYLREIPEVIGEIPTLELIDIKDCSKSLVESAKKIEEDQKNYGNYYLQVRAGHEIESTYKQMNLSPLRYVTYGNDEVYGLDTDVIDIKLRLFRQSSKLQVIPIMGVGGIGKTTLARTAYDDPFFLEHFDIRAWLTISQDYSPLRFRKILLGLLDSMELLDEKMSEEKFGESEMQKKVYQNLMGRKYLVVMDDVWSIDVWNALTVLFPDDGNGSLIMLTTRSADVCFHAKLGTFGAYLMHPMDEHQSWNLLKLKVFETRSCPRDLEKVGKEIVQGCAGVPLAIVLIAGVLLCAVDKTRAFWYEIAQREKPDVLPELQEILDLSYTHLPHHLRPCFLYAGIFPEYQHIDASKLLKSWEDEGLLKDESGCSKSEEDAEEYLDDLVKRYLVTVTSWKSNGKIKSCSIHDMVREFCIRKAEEEKFHHVMAVDGEFCIRKAEEEKFHHVMAVDGPHVPQGLMNEQQEKPTKRSFFMLLKDVLFCKAS